ncbi:CBL-interacting protein kinase 28 [Dissostichus eleginoides]|uniref:CBL-interacting protein kinase 28 n=1 Tax=Dissostichus eleginoides TaxID=100907 RepID=A0AAD9BAB6_DISEL|nr:CBL-interacting protein kinase 28 [Dissostichus eleginoides]
MSSKGAEIARRYRERRDADPDRRRKYLEKERDKWKKTERLERRRVSMSLVRERRGQKERNGERQKVKTEPETGPVLCYSQRHHQTPLQLLKISLSQGFPGNSV